MTVNNHDMNVQVRTTRCVHDDRLEEEQPWKELPVLTHGKRELWMMDRAKNVHGSAKLASIFLNEERGRICRLQKIKSVLASGTALGKKKKGRPRPCPNKSKRPPGYKNQSKVAPEIYGRPLPIQSHMSFIDKGKHDNGFASRGIKTLPPVTTDATRRVKSPTCSILKFGGGERQINRGCIEKGMSTFPPYALANILNHDGRYRLKVEPSDKACSSFHATKDGDEVIRSGPSALDLYYQDGLSSERTSRLEENVNTAEHTTSRTPNVYIPGNPTGNNTIATEDPLARTASAARPMLLPTITPSDSCNQKVHGTATTNNNTRDRNVASRNQIASGRKPFSLVSNSTSAVSASQQSQALPKGRMGDTRMTRRAGRDVGPKKLEPRTSHPHRLDPFHVETKVAAAKPERVRRRWKSSEGSVCPPPSQVQEAPKLEGCVKGPIAKKAQGRLQKDKSLDALKSEHNEALLILQGIDRLSTTTARKLKDDGQRGESVAIEGATERKRLQEHDDPTIGEISEVKAAGEGMAEPNAVGEEGLFASPPHITPRDEAAQRLMYRKWWLEIAKGENAFSSLEMSRKGSPDGGPTSFDGKAGRWSERANDGGGDGEKRQALAPKH